MNPKILVVDDDEEIRTQMKWALADSYEVLLAGTREEGTQAMTEHTTDVVLLDLGLPPHANDTTEGLLAMEEMLAGNPLAKIIVITGQSDRDNALDAIGRGAYDFLTKPIDTEELQVIIRRAFYVSSLEREHRELQQRLVVDGFEGMLGSSPRIREVFAAIRKVATTDVPVLILGESGTGKEMAAVALHNLSARKEGPFVAINCTAIPEPLLESELFGHEKGAFTGAHVQRKGRIEMASGGTLFLDEIGELPGSLQVKLLRFLQEQCIERVGGREQIEIDARVVAATNSNLAKAMHDNNFREDLYFRLAVVTLSLPPLREREGDAVMLAKAFIKRFTSPAERGKSLNQRAIRAVEAYDWPGNVRELENRVRRALIMTEGRRLSPADLELGSGSTAFSGMTLKEAREETERLLVERALKRHNGNISATAAALEISRPTLYELLDKLAIPRP